MTSLLLLVVVAISVMSIAWSITDVRHRLDRIEDQVQHRRAMRGTLTPVFSDEDILNAKRDRHIALENLRRLETRMDGLSFEEWMKREVTAGKSTESIVSERRDVLRASFREQHLEHEWDLMIELNLSVIRGSKNIGEARSEMWKLRNEGLHWSPRFADLMREQETEIRRCAETKNG